MASCQWAIRASGRLDAYRHREIEDSIVVPAAVGEGRQSISEVAQPLLTSGFAIISGSDDSAQQPDDVGINKYRSLAAVPSCESTCCVIADSREFDQLAICLRRLPTPFCQNTYKLFEKRYPPC